MKGEDLQKRLGDVLQALIDLEREWDNDYVRVWPEDMPDLSEFAAALRMIQFRTDEQALAMALKRLDVDSWEEGGSGAIFIPLPNNQQLGVDYNLGESWNVQFYPNVEDSDSIPLAVVSAQGDVPTVAMQVADVVKQFGRQSVPGASLADDDALNRISDTLMSDMAEDEAIHVIGIFVRGTGRKA